MNEISEKLILPCSHHCGDGLSQSMIQNQPESTEKTTVSQDNQVSPKLNIHDTKIEKIPVEHNEAFFEEHKTEANIPSQPNEGPTSNHRNFLDNSILTEMNPQISQRHDLLATSNPSFSIHGPLQHSEELVEPLELDREVDFGLPDEDENQESEEQVQHLITKMGNIKATFYLRHSMAFFIAFLLVSRYSLEFVDNGSCSKEIFIVLYTYLTYAFLEEVTFYFRYKTTDNDAKITYIYAGLDVFSLLCSLLILHLKFLNIFPAGKAASLPGFVICTLFYFSAYQRKGAKKLFLLKRILETIQIYLIEAKIDGGLAHLPWKSLLVYTWLYVGVRILLLLTSLKSVKPLIPQTSNKRANIFLTLWHYFYILLLLTVLVTYIGYSQAFDSKGSFDLLRKCLVGGQYFSAILFLLTILTKPFLIMVFTRASSMDYQSSEFGEMILDPLSIGISKQLKQEKKVVYFSMLSTTYFHEIKKGKFGQNRMGLEEFKQNIVFMLIKRLKEILHNNYDSLSQNLKKLVFQRIMDIQKNLMHHMTEVQLLDFRRRTTSANRTGNSQSTEAEPSFNRSELINLLDSLSAHAKRLWNIHKNRKPKSKDCAHEDEDDEYEMHDNGIDHTKTHENLCYVCFSQPADGVFMECGHAGFCFDCGLRYMTEKKECMTCRGATERVAKIDLKPVFGNVYKGYMVGKIVIAVDDNRCQWLIN